MNNPFQYTIPSRASPLNLASSLLGPQSLLSTLQKLGPQGLLPTLPNLGPQGLLPTLQKEALNGKRQNPGLRGRGSC